MIMGILAVFITVTSFFQNYLLMSTAASVAARMKTEYLKKILNQESAWYDQSNFMELSSRMNREVEAIKSGIGQKVGVVMYAVCMSVSGLFVGFYKGWSLTLAMFAIGPVLFLGMGIFGHIMQ